VNERKWKIMERYKNEKRNEVKWKAIGMKGKIIQKIKRNKMTKKGVEN
jgi:hypothetical protein